MSDDKKQVGVLNEGKSNKFIDNTFSNLDVGIHDKGKDTYAKGNNFLGSKNLLRSWLDSWWGRIIAGVAVGMVVVFLTYLFRWN
jgi:hypothetical protein